MVPTIENYDANLITIMFLTFLSISNNIINCKYISLIVSMSILCNYNILFRTRMISFNRYNVIHGKFETLCYTV